MPARAGPTGQEADASFGLRSKVKNVSSALEMYASDNAGRYPQKLEHLLPGNYLKTLPTCLAAHRMTFTDYHTGHEPDSFTFSCVGDNHARSYGHSALKSSQSVKSVP